MRILAGALMITGALLVAAALVCLVRMARAGSGPPPTKLAMITMLCVTLGMVAGAGGVVLLLSIPG